jgi:TaqI-like C-terminal specificity domain
VARLIGKIDQSKATIPLNQLCETTSGFGGKSELITEIRFSDDQIPTVKGDSIGRYEFRKSYWFDFKKENITGRTTDKRKLCAAEKIMLRKTGDRIIATYDVSGIYPEQSLYFLFNNRTQLRSSSSSVY